MNNKYIWISDEVFTWYVQSEGGSLTSYNDLMRAYELWNHARSILESKNDELHRVDAISTLKRCLNQRLKFIEYVYSLKQLASKSSPKGYLEYLETFKLVRPLMLKKLMTIRNDIEHNDVEPPAMGRCLELLDLTWYFLKSTDSILSIQRSDLLFIDLTDEGEETQYSFSVRIDYDLNHQLKISGWFPPEYILEEETSEHSKIVVEIMHTKEEKWSNEEHHKDKLETDIWVVGNLDASPDIKRTIIEKAFNAI